METDSEIKLKMPAPYKISDKLDAYNKSGLEKIITFRGSPIVETMFYLYLFKKYKSNCFLYDAKRDKQVLGLSIPILKKYDAYEKNKIEEQLDTMASKLSECIKRRNTTIIIIPINLNFFQGSHSNVLIFRKKYNQIEHFEPHGNAYMGVPETEANALNKIIKYWMKKFVSKVKKYVKPQKPIKLIDSSNVCPYLYGLQRIEEHWSNLVRLDDDSLGYCSAWSMFFTELCLKNPHIPSSTLITQIYDHFKSMRSVDQGNYLRNVIRGYARFINEKIEKYFSVFFSSGITIGKISQLTFKERQDILDILNLLVKLEMNMVIVPTYMEETIEMINYKLDLLNKDKTQKQSQLDKIQIQKNIEELMKQKYIFQQYKKANMDSNDTPNAEINLCPEGKTNRCIKDKTVTKSNKLCPEGKVINPKTGRCIKDKTKTVTKTVKNKVCPEGKVLNPKTGRCIKAKTQKII